MSNEKKWLKAAIYGGSGYGGSELLRILLFHPNVEIAFVTANQHAGKPVSQVHRNLLGITDLIFVDASDSNAALEGVDVAFYALPHGQAAAMAATVPDGVRLIDLSGDFRIDDAVTFERFYKFPHPGAGQRDFVYGLTETNRQRISAATRIANPGCFATAVLLGLAPITASGLTTGRIIVDAKTGSSGSGIKPAANTHHPQRTNSFYAYKPFTHQHVPEIEQHLRTLSENVPAVTMMTHSLPVSRGIFATCYVETTVNLTNEDLGNMFRHFYRESPFVRFQEGSPDINWVKNTNFCDLAMHTDGKKVVVFSAIDNLVKGAAGQAVQNMNVMFGMPEAAGLIFPGGNP